MAAQRKCGTPGCTLPDWHEGPCSTFLTEGKRKRLMVQPPPPPKKKPVVGAQSTISIPSELGAARAKRMRRVAPPSQVPAEQSSLPNGLQRFYHVHRWGVPLPAGPVDCGAGSDAEADEGWRFKALAQRTEARSEVGEVDGAFTRLWNAHVHALRPPLVSDRMLPGTCRQFARGNAAVLAGPLRDSFTEHLIVLWEHNLLHRCDVDDCIAIVELVANADRINIGSGGRDAEGASREGKDSSREGKGREGKSVGSRDGAKSVGKDTPSRASNSICSECSRPVHDPLCALSGAPRGIASWPLPQVGQCVFTIFFTSTLTLLTFLSPRHPAALPFRRPAALPPCHPATLLPTSSPSPSPSPCCLGPLARPRPHSHSRPHDRQLSPAAGNYARIVARNTRPSGRNEAACHHGRRVGGGD